MTISNVPTDRRYFIAWGTLSPRKGLNRLVRVYGDAVDHFPERDLLLAGGESNTASGYADTLRDLARERGVGERVHITGFLDDDEIREAFELADVFVHTPEDRTAASGPVSDAIRFRTPLVLTRTELFLEMFESDDVLFVDATDASVAAGLVRIAIDDDLRESRRKATYELYERLSWDSQAEEMYQLY